MEPQEIMVAFTAGDSPPLGNIWRITVKKTDFYLDPLSEGGSGFHLSAHGPNDRDPDGHRFHIKVDRKAVARMKAQGDVIEHSIPRKGFPIDGQEVAPRAFHVARIRWLWDLQRPRFREAAATTVTVPEITDRRSGATLSERLPANGAGDLDVFVSYDRPYWPDEQKSRRDNAQLGPLRNDAGLWLTATSYRRWQMESPTPERLVSPLPGSGDEPKRILRSGPDGEGAGMYWFVEAITSRQFLEAGS